MNHESLSYSLIGICILAACTARPVITQSGQEVGQAIEGEYAVCYGADGENIGQLNIGNGEYLFIPRLAIDNDLSEERIRFFFIEYQTGTYSVEYYGSIRSDSGLDSLECNEILLTIAFDAHEVENHDPDPIRDSNRVFLLRRDTENSRLCFHSTVSEFEQWSIQKPWNTQE